MKRLLCAASFVAGAIVLAGIAGCGRTLQADQAGGESQEPGIRVSTQKLKKKTLVRTTTQPARIKAYAETPLFAKIDGYVQEFSVDIGQPVKKGQVLAKLRVPEMQKELSQKKALVKQTAAEIEQADAEYQATGLAVTSAGAGVEEAQAAIVKAKGDEERWKSEYARMKNLVSSGSVTKQVGDETLQQFTAAEGAHQEANARFKSAKTALDLSLVRVKKAKADQQAAAARHEGAQAGVKHMQALLQYASIRAPFPGKVTQRNVDIDHFVSAGKKGMPLFVVTSTDKVRIFVDVPELEAALVQPGDPVSIRIPAMPGFTPGDSAPKVTRTSWSLQGAARTLLTEIEMDNKNGQLRPGMYASVTITLDERPGVFALPVSATVVKDDKAFCFCVNKGKAEKRAISLGLRSGDEVEVISGLSGSEEVIVTNLSSLQDGQAVAVGEEKK